MKIAICDDEISTAQRLETLIGRYFGQHNLPLETFRFGTGEALLNNGTAEFDIIFLDIRMGDLDGIATARRIRETNTRVFVVFVTAYIDHVLDGYTVEAYRYLLKEQLDAAIDDCLDDILKKIALYERKFVFDFSGGRRALYENQMVYIESAKHRLLFHVLLPEQTEYLLYGKLDDLESQLAPYGFCRIHQSYLVNLRYVEDMNNYTVPLKTGEGLPASKSKFGAAKEAYILYQGGV